MFEIELSEAVFGPFPLFTSAKVSRYKSDVIQIGGVSTTFCQEEGILLQKYRDRNERRIAILFRKYRGQGSM